MNGFQRHGFTHSSASSINLWHNSPDVFICEKLFGLRGPTSPAATRGIVIEKAIVSILLGELSHEEATKKAIEDFNARTAIVSSERTEAERDSIGEYIAVGTRTLSEYGQPEFEGVGKQNKIELLCRADNWNLPIIGFLDLVYPEQSLVIDVKTTTKIPKEMSKDHKRQAAIYAKATGKEVKFLYISPEKTALHGIEDVDNVLGEIKFILNRQEHFLRQGTKEELAKLVHYNPDGQYWFGNQKNREIVYGE